MWMTCPCLPRRSTSAPYSASGSQIRMSSFVVRNTLMISRLAEKDFPLPGVPRISPLGFFSSLRSTMIRLLLRAFRPQYSASLPVWNSSCVVNGTKMAVLEVVSPRCISISFRPRGRLLINASSCRKSRRVSWQLYFCAMLEAWNTLLSSCCLLSAVFSTRKVTRNIRSLRDCKSCKIFLASAP